VNVTIVAVDSSPPATATVAVRPARSWDKSASFGAPGCEVLIALTLNDVPIDVLAERLSTTRGALYKTLHDGRKKLRAWLATDGHQPTFVREGEKS